MVENMEVGKDAMHEWFDLTYANYLTVPRSVIQSMPGQWQLRLRTLLEEMADKLKIHGINLQDTKVSVKDNRGRFVSDDLADYQRGRRNVFADYPALDPEQVVPR